MKISMNFMCSVNFMRVWFFLNIVWVLTILFLLQTSDAGVEQSQLRFEESDALQSITVHQQLEMRRSELRNIRKMIVQNDLDELIELPDSVVLEILSEFKSQGITNLRVNHLQKEALSITNAESLEINSGFRSLQDRIKELEKLYSKVVVDDEGSSFIEVNYGNQFKKELINSAETILTKALGKRRGEVASQAILPANLGGDLLKVEISIEIENGIPYFVERVYPAEGKSYGKGDILSVESLIALDRKYGHIFAFDEWKAYLEFND